MRGSPQMTPECPSWSSAPWLLIWGGRSSSLSTIGLGFTSCKSGKKQDWPYVKTYWSRRMGTWGSPCLLLYFYICFEFSIMRKVLRLCYNLLKLTAGRIRYNSSMNDQNFSCINCCRMQFTLWKAHAVKNYCSLSYCLGGSQCLLVQEGV